MSLNKYFRQWGGGIGDWRMVAEWYGKNDGKENIPKQQLA